MILYREILLPTRCLFRNGAKCQKKKFPNIMKRPMAWPGTAKGNGFNSIEGTLANKLQQETGRVVVFERGSGWPCEPDSIEGTFPVFWHFKREWFGYRGHPRACTVIDYRINPTCAHKQPTTIKSWLQCTHKQSNKPFSKTSIPHVHKENLTIP